MADNLEIFGKSFSNVTGIKATDDNGIEQTFTRGGSAPVLQTKSVSPTTSAQTVTPDSGYDGLSSVTVNAMPSGSATTPATTITANPTISVNSSGLITASVSKTQGVTPTVSAGYVASGTSGTITVNGSNTQQLTAKSEQTYTPTTADQFIASGRYLTGVQTIKGDANLIASNIADGVSIFGVTGTHSGGGVQTTAIAASFKGKAYYTDASGTVQTITAATPMPGVDSFSDNAISTSICTILSGSVLSSTGLTLIERFDLGSSATHRYAYIYQVN